MPNYSIVFSDEKIIRLALKNHAKTVLVLGCDGCMNESLALFYDRPIVNYGLENSNIPIHEECQRICSLLIDNGIEAKYEVIGRKNNAFCIRDADSIDYQLSNYYTPDLVMVLSCPAGIWSIKQCMNEATVVGIASLKGVFSYSYCDDGNKRIIKDAQITHF